MENRKILFVVKVQSGTELDACGRHVYKRCLSYIANAVQYGYEEVVAAVDESLGAVEFLADAICGLCRFSPKAFPYILPDDTVDIIGFDTDGSLLSVAFNISDIGCNVRILQDMCWTDGGLEMHEHALEIMRRQFGCVHVVQDITQGGESKRDLLEHLSGVIDSKE